MSSEQKPRCYSADCTRFKRSVSGQKDMDLRSAPVVNDGWVLARVENGVERQRLAEVGHPAVNAEADHLLQRERIYQASAHPSNKANTSGLSSHLRDEKRLMTWREGFRRDRGDNPFSTAT